MVRTSRAWRASRKEEGRENGVRASLFISRHLAVTTGDGGLPSNGSWGSAAVLSGESL
jgi:hypothetical protein